jgi:hypothetical protein
MLRTSRCFRINYLQFAGPRPLSAIALLPYKISRSCGKSFSFSPNLPSVFSGKSNLFLPYVEIREQSILARQQFAADRPLT